MEECGRYPVDFLPSAKASFKSVQQEGIQGLLFTGGGDLDPLSYGEQNRASEHVDDDRDKFEIGLMAGALGIDLPIFAISRSWRIRSAHNRTE